MTEKEKWTSKKNGKRMWLILDIFSFTIQLVIPNVCVKFQNPKLCSSCEIFDENFPIHYIGVRERKGGKDK